MQSRAYEISASSLSAEAATKQFLRFIVEAILQADDDLREAVWKLDLDALSAEDAVNALQAETDHCVLRLVHNIPQGFAAIDYADLKHQTRWEAYVSTVDTDSGPQRLITGCRYPSSEGAHEPEAWLSAISGFELGQPVTPAQQPDFLTLASIAVADAAHVSVSSHIHERAMLDAELAQAREMLHEQSLRNAALQESISKAKTAAGTTEPETTDLTYADIGQWAADNLERIVVLPRAVRGARNSHYENPKLVFDCLEFLASTYRLVKLDQMDRTFNREACEQLGVSIGGSVDKSNAGEAGAQYFVQWNGRKRFLDQHLGKGNIRDPRMCMRIYFTWCEDTQRVVVGSMTEHLDVGST